jgi:CDP-glycerol glycerophosphotransferase
MKPKLSVVVPMFDVELYLPPLLASLASQELEDIEVILVDDGSTDATARIAAAQAAHDPRFSVITQANSGLSAARNAGIRRATGEYLAFADADDLVPAYAYRVLVESLEESGSDIVSGDVRRMTSQGTSLYPGYAETFATARRRTHITRDEALIADRMVWNKVFRRSFWDEQGLAFRLPQYEDGPVTIRAHIAATAVDVVPRVVYLWRIRERGEPSITQRQYEAANIGRRMRMMVDISDIIRELAPGLSAAYARDMLRGDIAVAMTASTHNNSGSLAGTVALVKEFVGTIDGGVLGELDDEYRRRVFLLVDGRVDELREQLLADGRSQ